MAFVSTDTGRREVYVTSFPETGPRWQISNNGADYPSWRRDSKELYFLDNNMTIHAVAVHANDSEFEAGTPRPLFRTRISGFGHTYDVNEDGTRFLVNTGAQDNPTPLTLVVNWTAELGK